jgi:hypothetical protein
VKIAIYEKALKAVRLSVMCNSNSHGFNTSSIIFFVDKLVLLVLIGPEGD